MPYTRLRETKDGRHFYEIQVSRGRGKTPYSTRWYVPDGWSKKSIERELKSVAAEFERQCKAGEVLTRQEKREKAAQDEAEAAKILTLRQFGERVYMPSKSVTISENSRSSFQGYLSNRIYPAIGDFKMPEITPAMITVLLVSMQSEGKAHATVIKVYTILNSLFKMAFMSDMIKANPMHKVERPRPRKDEVKATEVAAYTVEEMQHILLCLEQEPLKWHVYVRLLVDTGIRRGECCGLRWENVDFKENRISISGNLCYTPQKGVYLDTPKSGKYRSMDVDPDVMDLLRAWRNEQSGKNLSAWVFTQENSADVMHPQSPTRYLKKFAERYGIKDMHPHKLRHSFASIAITAGADIASVSEKLGHSDKAVTLRMYTHASEESIRKAGNIFRDALKQTDKAKEA